MATAEQCFADLFRGRIDAYGLVHGECVRGPVTQTLYDHHLHEEGWSLGIYPLVEMSERIHVDLNGHIVAWGCSDVDDGFEKSLPLAVNLHKVLRHLGITSWVERTKGKGFHVWVFVKDWVEAVAMRHALLFAHQIAGVKPTEVNPKAVDTSTMVVGLGNYVNLPYAKDWQGTGKREVIHHDSGRVYQWDQWTEMAHRSRNTPDAIRKVAALYKPPPPPKPVRITRDYVGGLERLTRRLSPLAYKIFKDGVLEGRDRSGTLQRLAFLMAEDSDLSASEAAVLLHEADSRWGKFHDRKDGAQRLDDMIRRAYG